ncbi:MAG: hypothetical protein ABI467_04655 [Kofleriaceae bacterium]
MARAIVTPPPVMRTLVLSAVFVATASAQPVTAAADVPPLAEPRARATAEALMTEGGRRLGVQAYDQALANFLEAYNRFPSPKILLEIASTLNAMGRLADAANTYQRYLDDPATGAARVAEVKERLLGLDSQVTLLTVHVTPHGGEVSIDAGPFVEVGSSLQTRIRAGTHTIRIRHGGALEVVDLNSFEGEAKDVPDPPPAPAVKAPDQVQGWLIAGRSYGTVDAHSRERRVHANLTGPVVEPYVPSGGLEDDDTPGVGEPVEHLASGVIGIARIDGNHWQGFAGGLGLAYAASDTFEVELEGLKSDIYGAYAGARYLLLTGGLRPYLAAGIPMFLFTDDSNERQISLGGRLAAGIELEINDHLSVQGDLGIEHFFNVGDVIYKMQTFEATTFAPTVGVIGRL